MSDSFSDELSELVRTEGEITKCQPTNNPLCEDDITRIKQDILNILRITSKIDKDLIRLRGKVTTLCANSTDQMLSNLVTRLDKKANRSDVQLLSKKIDHFEEFLKGDCEEDDTKTPLECYVAKIVNEACADKLARFDALVNQVLLRFKIC